MSTDRASNPTADPPGDSIPLALRQRLQQCYQHGSKLMEKEKYDFDYANTMFTECVVRDPRNLVYVEAFLTNLDRKYDGNKRGSRFPTVGGSKSAFKKAYGKKNWVEVLKLGPDVLKSNPWDVPTLRAMAEACEALEYREVELRYLKIALDCKVKDPDVNRHCARSLQRMGQFDQAIVCWHRVEEAKKNDVEAPKMIAQLQMEKTRERAGYGPAQTVGGSKGSSSKSSSNLPPPQTTAAAGSTAQAAEIVEAKRREVQLTPRQQLEQRLAEFPEDTETALALAKTHLDEDRTADAERVLSKALSAAGNDLRIRERLEEVIVVKQRQRLAVAERLAVHDKNDTSQQLVGQLRQELHRAELDFYVARTERYPTDLALKYHLGVRLRRIGSVAEAAKVLLESAQSGPLKGVAYLELGECLQLLKQYPKAFEAYKRAIAAATETKAMDLKKSALYRAGILAAGLKELVIAEKLLWELLELDPHYKDTRDRLDKITQIRDKG